jgi:SAM-dependent methyltransferase
MRKYFEKLYHSVAVRNQNNIFSLLEKNKKAKFLDLGCDDGALTLKLATRIGTKNIYGVEIVDERIKKAQNKGIKVKKFDLNNKFDFSDNFFDIIHANQVIEHIHNSDNFISEIYRVLKPGGYAILSTENASSWCNIFASLMGWQIFSLTNFSAKKLGLGNPWAIHRNDGPNLASWNHVRIYNIRGLKEYFKAYGFKISKIKGAGYFPLPSILGNIDKTHCHFMAFKVRKI